MSDFLKLYNEATGSGKENQEPENIDNNPYPSTAQQIAQSEARQGNTDTDSVGSAPANIPGTEEEQRQSVNQAMSQRTLEASAGEQEKEMYTDPDSWSPEYTARGFINETSNSIIRGFGNHIVKGTGDMMQGAMAISGLNPRGNFITNYLQEAGEEISDDWRAFVPEELQHENLNWDSLANPRFWSQNVAEMIPQLAEFILLSKGGSAAARWGGKKALQKGQGKILGKVASATDDNIVKKASHEVFGSGSGIAGKLATEKGLTNVGKQVFGTIGGGVAGNAFSGLLNAAEVVNDNKDSGIFTDEELGNIAASTYRNNMSWLGIDMLSWGYTYGGLGRGLGIGKKLGNAVKNAGNSTKIGKEIFKYDVAPILKGVGRFTKKAGFEAVEETFQETFEEWSQRKAMADQTGMFSEGLWDVPEFLDFYKSKENRGTIVLSGALGALGGGAFNIETLINSKAEEAYKFQNRTDNFKNITKKAGTKEEESWQRWHIFKQMSEIVTDGRLDLYDDFSQKLVDNQNITEEEKAELDKEFQLMQEMKAKGKRLNVRGQSALMHWSAQETYFSGEMDKIVEESKEKIAEIQKAEFATPAAKRNAIEKEERAFKERHHGLSVIRAKAAMNKENLILGKKAVPSEFDITIDKYGNEIFVEGLSTQDFYKYTKEGEKAGKGEKFKEGAKSKFKIPSMEGLSQKAKEMVNKAKEAYAIFRDDTQEMDENGNPINKNKAEEQTVEDATVEPNKELRESSATSDRGETEVNGEKVQTPGTNRTAEEANEEDQRRADQRAKEQAEEMQRDAEKKAQEEAQAREDEPIDDDTWNDFDNNSTVTQGTIDDIADAIMEEQPLSRRQEEIRGKNKGRITSSISQKLLGRRGEGDEYRGTTMQSDEMGEGAKKAQEKERLEGIRDRFRDILGSLKRKVGESKKQWQKRVEPDVKKYEEETGEKFSKEDLNSMMNGTMEAEFEVVRDEDLEDTEAEYMESELQYVDKNGNTINKAQHEKNKKAMNKFKPKKKNVKNAKDVIDGGTEVDSNSPSGMEKRDTTALQNIMESQRMEEMFKKARRRKAKLSGGHFSQNELDNYLNRMSAFNEFGPTELEKMQTVNYHLKNMFPNAERPTQVYIIDNLYHTMGSIGLGYTLAGTIFIDEKSWDQDEVFMHELSHVYYNLAKDEKITKDIIKDILRKDKALVAEIKKNYDDYTLYDVVRRDGSVARERKSDIFAMFRRKGFVKNTAEAEALLQKTIEQGKYRTVPLSQQELLIEEMFVKRLEGPLAANYDKIFQPKNEPKRQQDSKLWWGMLRKKGEILESNNGVDTMLNKLYEDGVPQGNLKDHVFEVFRSVTKGQSLNYAAMEKRASEYNQAVIDQHNEIRDRLANERSTGNPIVSDPKVQDWDESSAKTKEDLKDQMDDHSSEVEEQGNAFLNKDFNSKAKGASRILRRFGAVYNKVKRKNFLEKAKNNPVDWKKAPTFDRDMFESTIYELAMENDMVEFIRQIENSSLAEVQAFNRFLDKTHKGSKLQALAGMHFVFSNSKHINGVKNTVNNKNQYEMEASLSLKEQGVVENILTRAFKDFKKDRMKDFWKSVNAIYGGSTKASDYKNILNVLTAHSSIKTAKILDQGFVTYQGMAIPIETLITGIIKKGDLYKRSEDGNVIVGMYNTYSLRPLVEAIVDTNRKFTPTSMVENAEQNYEPVRITNNHLTNEVESMLDFLEQLNQDDKLDDDAKKKAFLKRFSHMNERNFAETKGKAYIPNKFLEGIYDNYQEGILPQITQYHGIRNTSDNQSSLYKNSTALEQGIEDFLIYRNSSRTKNGRKRRQFLANLGAFSDSPRKFMMNMNRVDYDDIFDVKPDKNGKMKRSWKRDGEVLNSMFHTFQLLHPKSKYATNKLAFKKGLDQAIKDHRAMLEDNYTELSKIDVLRDYFDHEGSREGKLNEKGLKLAAEYVVNYTMAGVNVSDVFLPNIESEGIVKRMKANSSPIFSSKNPNFKFEPLFYSDEIVNNGIAGTDSSMYILKEDAERLQNLGKGVFDMNNGFKLLNSSIEKDNPNYEHRMAYLKGYTTVIDEGHPLYNALRARKDKYNEWHKKTYGKAPSMDLNDNTPNHMVIAMPQSSDKSNFYKKQFTKKVKNEDGSESLIYTEDGLKRHPGTINDYLDEFNAEMDKDFYDSDGNFVGLSAYNFGPQQVMDRITQRVNTPVQMENSIIVRAAQLEGGMELALEIQQHISNQKWRNLQKSLDKIASQDPEAYKKFIEESLNKEDMDQVQKILLEDGGSLAHPAINEIVVSQLAKTIRREGNKLLTPGTLAHQKGDIGVEGLTAVPGKRLQGYKKNGTEGLLPAEIVLPKHMKDKFNMRTRTSVTWKTNSRDIQDIKDPDKAMQRLYEIAFREAKKRSGNPEQMITKKLDDKGRHIGWDVSGSMVIASRVPGHGPSSTGVFEVVGFDESTDGNQVMVPAEFNEIIGADNDGDALFIQTQGGPEFHEWNQAFEKFTKHWLSPGMQNQIRTKMDWEDGIRQMIKENFGSKEEKNLPFTPSARMVDYNNTMVSQRNISPVFSTHKVTNMLAAYNIGFDKPIIVNGKRIERFEEFGEADTSRNQLSAVLANIILDNSKHGFADALGLDEHNISQATIMVNLGFSMKEVGMILNSPGAREWSNVNRKNNSIFHQSLRKKDVINKVYENMNLGKRNTNMDAFSLNLDKNHLNDPKNAAEVIEFLSYLSDMNSEVQKVSSIMSGHNKIHVNPLVLEKQLEQYEALYKAESRGEDAILNFTNEFENNPNLKNYVAVAKATLDHTKTLNPIYRKATNKVLKDIEAKIGREVTPREMEQIAENIKKFNTSRLLGFNNTSKAKAKLLLEKDETKPGTIYHSLKTYIDRLGEKNIGQQGRNEITDSVDALDNSILFNKAISYSFNGNSYYISLNPEFGNESFTKEEREQAQREFEEMPVQLQDDLMLFDLINRGWKGKTSLASVFGREANNFINMAADYDLQNNKDKELSDQVTRELERVIALKESKSQRNPFIKVKYDRNRILRDDIVANEDVRRHLLDGGGGPLYVVARGYDKNNVYKSTLYEMEGFTQSEKRIVKNIRNKKERNDAILEIAKMKFQRVPDTSGGNYEMELATIADPSQDFYFRNSGNRENNKYLEPMTMATYEWEEIMGELSEGIEQGNAGMEAREDFYIDLFTKETPLTQGEFEQAMEYDPNVSAANRLNAYNEYLKEKEKANFEASSVLKDLDKKSEQQLLDLYSEYGNKNVYAYSNIITPVLQQLANKMANGQAKIWKDNNVEGKGFDGKDVSKIQAYLMGGSTIPSNHPTSQAMARVLETQYKKFVGEKSKRIRKMNEITEQLYKKKLGYGTSGFINKLRAIRDAFVMSRNDVYQRLYGNLVIRKEIIDPETGKITYDFRLRSPNDIQKDFDNGVISKEEKDFYDFFKQTTTELKPEDLKNTKEDYIPHTAMNTFEAFGSRGLLGLMINSRSDKEGIYDVKMRYKHRGKDEVRTFKEIEDIFKGSAALNGKNDINKITEYRRLKRKAQKLYRDGKNEDGSSLEVSGNLAETALGFGVVNRFENNRSVKAEEMPSMDLNKALGDYIHSTIFTNGAGDFKGMKNLQGYIDAALAFNENNNLKNMNDHVQKVWKDYFLRGKRQESVLGKKTDDVIRGLTRLNLFYALGYQANKNTGGLYALGNVLVGKYHNIKDLGGKAWIDGEKKYWGLDKGFEGGIDGVWKRHKRMQRIMKNLNFMDINIYDEVNIEKSTGIDSIFSKLALAPMIYSEEWIQKVHMLGMIPQEVLDQKFDENGEYKKGEEKIDEDFIVQMEDQVKKSHGRGYQPTDQRAIQMYSYGNMMLQFSRFIPTMIQDRFGKKDVNIYGQETIGSLRATGKMIRYVVNNPTEFVKYRKSLSDYERQRLDSGLKGLAMSAVIGMGGAALNSDTMNELYWDANYYFNYDKLSNKMVPPAIQSTNRLVSQLF